MALPDITQRLKLQAEGVQETETSSANIHKNLVGAAQAAEALARAQSDAARKATLKTTKENVEYGQMRGSAGATGAAARDFAEQSRGLGGLVRLYATFAANIFAVSAAFNVLRNAMDTSNMIAGLNALGAESGRSLGTLSKQLVTVTDGAISLREAMSATAMASSAGLSNQQIIKLGQVAKTTSLALGISMPDAINRLSRGITKLEPELLDELGIFTKIEPATQAYALQLGKAASQLTDFERRQAFANAVLKEGEDKFKALETAAANPYDKLLAGLKDVAFQGLELINKVLTPIVKILAESPGALAAGLVTVIGLLVRQAIPAITEIRAGLAAGADKALQTAKGKAGDVLKAREQLNRLIERDVEASADKELKVLEQKEARINELKSQGYKFSKQLTEALKKDITDLTEQEIKAAKAQAQRLQTRAATSTDPNFKARAQAEMDTVKALEAHYQAEENLTAVKIRNREEITKTVQESRQYQKLQAEVSTLEEAATKKAILSNMAYNTSLVGVRNAWKLMRDEIENSNLKLNAFSGAILNLRGAFAGLIGIVSTLGAAINKAFFIITTFIAIVEVLDSFFSKNEKQAKAFNTAIDNANTSVENAKRTIENFNSKASLEKDSIKSVNAMSTAFNELTLSIESTIVKAEESKKAMSGFDKKIDWIKDLIGFGTEDKLAKSLTEQLTAGLNLAAKVGKSPEFKSKFQALLRVEDLYDADKVEAAIRKLDEKGRKAFIELISGVNSSVQKANSILQSFQSSTDKAAKTFQEFIQSTASKDQLFLFSEALLNASYAMQDLANAPAEDIIRGVQDLTQNTQKLVLYSNEFADSIISMKSSFEAQKSYLNDNTLEIEKFNEGLRNTVTQTIRVSDAQEKLKVAQENLARVRTTGDKEARRQAALDLKAAEAAATNASYQRTGVSGIPPSGDLGLLNQAGGIGAAGAQVLATSVDLFRKEAANLLVRSQELANKAISNAQIQAGITMARAFSQVLTGPRAVAVETAASKREIQLRIDQVKISLDLLNTQDRLTSAIEDQTAATLANTEQLKPAGERNQTILQNAQVSSEAIQAFKEFIDKAGKMPAGSITAAGQAFAAERNLSPQALAQFSQRVSGFALRRQQQQASLIGLNAEMRATEFTGQVKSAAATLADRRELEQIETSITQIRSNRIGLIQQIAGLNTQELIDKKTALEYEIQATKNNQEIAELERKISNAKTASLSTDKDVAAEGKAELKRLQDQIMPATVRRQQAETTAISERKIAEELQLQLEKIRKNSELSKSTRDLVNAKEEARLEIQRAQFTSAVELYDLDKQFALQKLYELDLEKSIFDTAKQAAEINATFKDKELETQARVNSLKLTGAELDKKMKEEMDRLSAIKENQLAQLDEEKKKREELLRLQRNQALEQARIAYEMDRANRVAEALAGAFGTAGQKLGELSTTITKNNIAQEQGEKALSVLLKGREELQKKIDAAPEGEAKNKLLDERQNLIYAEGRQIAKNRDTELAGNAKVLNSTKSLFKEHTAAYKTLDKMEKATHILRMTNTAVEFATKIKTFALEIAAAGQKAVAEVGLENASLMAKIPAYTAGIFGKITSQIGLPGPVVAAGIVAAIFAAFGGGRGGGVNTAGLTAEDMNKVAGTGQQYQDGKIVTRSGGVTGDPTAMADSITSSMDMLNKNFFNLLGSNNSAVVKGLKGIERNTGETVKALIGEVSGFAGVNQSAFGTTEGTTSSFNIWWGGGKKRTTEILSAGIQVIGTLDDIINKTANATFNTFETTKKTVKKSFLGITYDTDSTVNTAVEKLNKTVVKGIQDTFGSVVDTISAAAVALEGSSQRVSDIVKNFQVNLKVNLKDLTGEEAVARLTAELSIVLNNLTEQIFPFVKEFNVIGEELFETGSRLAAGTQAVKDSFFILGKAPQEFTSAYERIKFEQQLIEASGGLDKFASDIQFFVDNFYTEAQKLAPYQKNLVDTLRELGLETVDTKEEFARLVDSIKPVDAATIELRAKLLDLAPAFIKVYGEASNTIDKLLLDLVAETNRLESTATPLQTALQEIVTKTADYVEQLDKASASYEANLKVIARWSKASALKELRGNLQTAYEDRKRELEGSIKTWQDLGKNLDRFLTTLRTGSESILSPQEKYAALFNQYQQTLTDVQSTDQAVAQAAAQALPTVSTDLLKAGSALYGSSLLYQILFDEVEQGLKNAKTIIGTQESETQKLLTETQLRVSPYLLDIKTNTADAATRLNNLVTAISAWDIIDEATLANQLATAIKGGTIPATAVDTSFTAALAAAGTKPIGTPTLPTGAGSGTGNNPNDGPIDNWMSGIAFTMATKYSDFNWRNYLNANADLTQAGIDTQIEAQRHFSLYGINEGRKGGSSARDAELAAIESRKNTDQTTTDNDKLADALIIVGDMLTSNSKEETDKLLTGLTKIIRTPVTQLEFGKPNVVER